MTYCIVTSPGYFRVGANPQSNGFGGHHYFINSARELHRWATRHDYVLRPFRGQINKGQTLKVKGGEYTISMAELDFNATNYFSDKADFDFKLAYADTVQGDRLAGHNYLNDSFTDVEISLMKNYFNGEKCDPSLKEMVA